MTQPSNDHPENENPAQNSSATKEFRVTFENEIRLATVFGFATGLFAGAVLVWVITHDR